MNDHKHRNVRTGLFLPRRSVHLAVSSRHELPNKRPNNQTDLCSCTRAQEQWHVVEQAVVELVPRPHAMDAFFRSDPDVYPEKRWTKSFRKAPERIASLPHHFECSRDNRREAGFIPRCSTILPHCSLTPLPVVARFVAGTNQELAKSVFEFFF